MYLGSSRQRVDDIEIWVILAVDVCPFGTLPGGEIWGLQSKTHDAGLPGLLLFRVWECM